MLKLTVITICYNEPYLEKTCESIVNQTWQDFEWIVVDGGSNQETLDKFEKYKKRIDKFISEPDNGIYDACNKGIELANGEYVIFMNAGDSFYSHEVLSNIFSKHNYTSGILYGDTVMIDNKIKKSKQKHCAKIPHKISKCYFYTATICTQSMFVKKELYYKYGLHNLKYKILGDLDRNLAFVSNGENFEYIPEIVSYYDKNGISSSLKTIDVRLQEQKEIIKTYFDSDEISFYENLINFKYKNIFERLFSIKKQFSAGKFYNTITIFWIKIKIKYKNFNNFDSKNIKGKLHEKE